MARPAMTEYPSFLGIVEVVLMGVFGGKGWFTGLGKSLRKARNVSRMKLEKLVKEPQKPVASPIYSGMVFLALVCEALEAGSCSSGAFSISLF